MVHNVGPSVGCRADQVIDVVPVDQKGDFYEKDCNLARAFERRLGYLGLGVR